MLQRVIPFITGVLIGLLAAGLVLLLASPPRGYPVEILPPEPPPPLDVHVTGEVLHPGVYQLMPGMTLMDAVQAAGGPTDRAWLEAVNLAAEARDGQQLHIQALPSQEGGTQTPPILGAGRTYNLNTITREELESLPGIGPVLAENILQYRREKGPFTALEELLEVSGIGPSKLEALRDLLYLP